MSRPPSRALLRTLAARETGASHAVGVIVIVGAGWLAAAAATGDFDGGPGSRLVLRALRRTDLVLLTAAAVLAAMRIMTRIAEDHGSRWLEPYSAAGGSRARYVAFLPCAVMLPWWVLFIAGAAAFGAGVAARGGGDELLRELPVLAPAGLLFIGAVAAHGAAFAVLLREPLAAMLAAAVFAAAPYITAAVFIAQGGDVPPVLLRGWLNVAVPFGPAASAAEAVRQLSYVGAAMLVAVGAGRRLAGRRP